MGRLYAKRESKWGCHPRSSKRGSSKGITDWIFAIVCVVLFLLATSCGSVQDFEADEIVANQPSPEVSNPSQSDEITKDPVEKLILSENYAGSLIIHFNEDLKVRQDKDGRLYSKTSPEKTPTLSSMQSILNDYPDAKLEPTVDSDPDVVDVKRAELEELSGEKLADFNSIYHFEIKDAKQALNLYRALLSKDGVAKIYPKTKPIYFDLASTPDLTGLQGYLEAEDTVGGLNARAAWNAGIKGQGVVMFHAEGDWNFEHDDLPIRIESLLTVRNCTSPNQAWYCPSQINHGTGVIGIYSGVENGRGITGFSPQSSSYVGLGIADPIHNLTDGDPWPGGIRGELPEGSVIVVTSGIPGAKSQEGVPQYGGLPAEVEPNVFAAVKQATAKGVTVVIAAGNGSISLDDPADYYSYQINTSLPQNDTGAILVGGSYGINHNHRKPTVINCGSRINSYAWASGVVTTGLLYSGNPYVWNTVPGGPNPPNTDTNAYFINNFGGTSAAAPMVAGAAALVQSYFKRESGSADTRYLMPLKLREILVNSGVPHVGGTCGIGKQPRVDVAMQLVDQYIAQLHTQYPELFSNTPLASKQRIIELRQNGVGIVCNPYTQWSGGSTHPPSGDAVCPEEVLWPTSSLIAKPLDFDGDGRADLVQWTNPSTGSGLSATWKLDLSTRCTPAQVSSNNCPEDKYGAWDIEISYPSIQGRWVWPYVSDMNSDNREDFVVYDKEHGKFYIKFTTTDFIENGTWHGWDWVIDYSSEWTDTLTMDPFGEDPNISDSRYSRPTILDYNFDGWSDIAIICSDGVVRVDYGGSNRTDFGSFDHSGSYLTQTQLSIAPGWAYTTYLSSEGGFFYKIPDGINSSEEGRLINISPGYLGLDALEGSSYIFGGNDKILLIGHYVPNDNMGFGLKSPDGRWDVAMEGGDYDYHINSIEPSSIYGGESCHPITADFDGDSFTDRAVMCSDEWRIAYSSDNLFTSVREPDRSRIIHLSNPTNALPGRTYSGGRSYSNTRQLMELFRALNPNTLPPIMVDVINSN